MFCFLSNLLSGRLSVTPPPTEKAQVQSAQLLPSKTGVAGGPFRTSD